MAGQNNDLSTGIAGLDRVLRGLLPGDNVVWHVDTIDDYRAFVKPFCAHTSEIGQTTTYFRFGLHEPLVVADANVEVVQLHPELGFENFICDIHHVLERNGSGGAYVFDSLSELADEWFSDQMLTNFFMLTCPYLYDLQTLAYFAVISKHHSLHVRGPIGQTAQILIDVYRHNGKLYVQPIKVQQRYSPEIHMLHVWDGDCFYPVSESAVISEILTFNAWGESDSVWPMRGVYRRVFAEARKLLNSAQQGELSEQDATIGARGLFRRVITRDERLLGLCQKYMPLADVLEIPKRLVSTGQIGGKAVGMLLARAILKKKAPRIASLLEPHDSFFVASDAFYTFLVDNGCWWERQQQRKPETMLAGAAKVRQLILRGQFTDYMTKQFSDIVDYFGQSPIIVRSSSLLEDSFGHSFSGKYESVFCANRGSHRTRLQNFVHAVRTVYASCMSEQALRYRARRGILDLDEQMALLVQRVSGAVYGEHFFPQCAGVAFSYNPYVWNKDIDPAAGVLRLVFGMGTRAVDRSDDDYTRIVALNAPLLRPDTNFEEMREHAQRRVDLLDLRTNLLLSCDFSDLQQRLPESVSNLFVSLDDAAERLARDRRERAGVPWLLTFEKLLTQTTFVNDMREILATLEQAYDHPVDVEFTANFFGGDNYKINILQCRPFLVNRTPSLGRSVHDGLSNSDLILRAHGAVIGTSRTLSIDRVIFVLPSSYARLTIRERYRVARAIGDITRLREPAAPETIMLLGPGRWGTSTPSLGVPVQFGEISNICVLCEIVSMGGDITPDVSLGAHFFNDFVEQDILYLALFPERADNHLSEEFFERQPNRLADLLPDYSDLKDVIKIIDGGGIDNNRRVVLDADAVDQTAVVYVA